MSVFAEAIARVKLVKSTSQTIQTEPFLSLCRETIPIVEKMGPSFALVRSDVGGNIDRLEERRLKNPGRFSHDIFQIIEEEYSEHVHTDSSSCTKGLLWLKRAMEFLIAILENVSMLPEISMHEAVTDAYKATLQQYHGWIVSSTFSVAFAFVPNRDTFLEKLGEPSQESMREFTKEFGALIKDVHNFLERKGLDDPTKV